VHADGFHRRQKDYRIPGHAILGDPGSASGRLPNSFVEQSGGTFGASWIGSRGYIGASAALIDAQYGIPTEERPFIGLHQKRLGVAGEVDEPFGAAQRARARVVATDYQHIEYEADKTPGTTFTNRGFEARGDVALKPGWGWSSVVGVQGYSHELAAIGEEAVVPRTRGYGAGLFALAERELGPGWRGDAGIRIDQERRDPEGDLPTRTFTPFQGALGLVYRADAGVAALSVTYAERAPSIEELYSNGPHHATATFDIGDPRLGKEKSANVDFSLRRTAGAWTGTVSLFASETRGFVYGAFVDADEDGVADHADDEGHPDPDGELVVQVFTPGRARFYGLEAEITYRPANDGFFARAFGDYVRGRLRNAGNLPRMPAGRLGAELGFARGPFSAVATVVHGFRQNRVAPLESPTPSYTRLDLEASYRFRAGNVAWLLFARGLNLTDEDIRVATSYLKDVAPLPGRSLLVGVRAEL
jgi:iron complex outermembrane receptor protein